jgi:hypothetical protein
MCTLCDIRTYTYVESLLGFCRHQPVRLMTWRVSGKARAMWASIVLVCHGVDNAQNPNREERLNYRIHDCLMMDDGVVVLCM